MKTRKILGLAVLPIMTIIGCREYDVPEFVDVETSESAFVVPLEDEANAQAQFQSEEYLEKKKVALKRIQIPHRWNSTGYTYLSGEWIDTIRVVKVDRAPVTREWDADKDKTKAIWLESQDSIGFSMGFNCTAMIEEQNAAKFLYYYKGGTLQQVMDGEVRNRIMQVAYEVTQDFPLDSLRSQKQQIIDAVRKDVIPYFAEKGITIAMLGMYGGMTYENASIQKSIDDVFIAQQEKAVNLARFEAQQKANERLELEAKGLAEKARLAAQGVADAKLIEVKAESEAIAMRVKAIRDAGPSIFQLRQLEIDQIRAEKWDGKWPMYYFGGKDSGGMGMLLSLPSPAVVNETK